MMQDNHSRQIISILPSSPLRDYQEIPHFCSSLHSYLITLLPMSTKGSNNQNRTSPLQSLLSTYQYLTLTLCLPTTFSNLSELLRSTFSTFAPVFILSCHSRMLFQYLSTLFCFISFSLLLDHFIYVKHLFLHFKKITKPS